MTHPLKKYIEAKGMSLSELAKLTDLDRSTLHRYIRGVRQPTLTTMRKIFLATKGEVTPTELVMYVENN